MTTRSLAGTVALLWRTFCQPGRWICTYHLERASSGEWRGEWRQASIQVEGSFVLTAATKEEALAGASHWITQHMTIGGQYVYRVRRPLPWERAAAVCRIAWHLL